MPGSFWVSGRCLRVSVMRFQDKFTSLRQVNNPNSWEKFQICCTDLYLIRFLPNFAVFCMFLWICGSATTRKFRSPDFELYHLHRTNWRLKICIWRIYFFSWSPKGDYISSVGHQKATWGVFLILNRAWAPEKFIHIFTCWAKQNKRTQIHFFCVSVAAFKVAVAWASPDQPSQSCCWV